jgi:hypothetical protein
MMDSSEVLVVVVDAERRTLLLLLPVAVAVGCPIDAKPQAKPRETAKRPTERIMDLVIVIIEVVCFS